MKSYFHYLSQKVERKMDKIFRSKVDLWFHVIILCSAVLCVYFMWSGLIVPIILSIALVLLFTNVLQNTTYTITTSNDLVLKCSKFKEASIPISSITSIDVKGKKQWLYALSSDKIYIHTGEKVYAISPENKDLFLKFILRINPNIEVKMR